MSYLSVNREKLVADLRDSVAEIQFQKKDGSRRTLICTLKPSYLPEEYRDKIQETVNRDNQNDVLAVWDVEANAWRSFRLDWIYSVQARDGY